MQIKETPDVSFPGVVESPPLEDVVVLADSAGVALGYSAHSARGCGASPMMAAVSSRPGAWRSRSSGATARSPGSCAGPPHGPTRAACSPPAGRRGRRRWGSGAVRGPRHQQPSRCDRQRPAAARVPERRRIPKGHRQQDAARDHARSVAQPSAPRRCATMPQVDRRVRRRQPPRSAGGHAGPGVASRHHGPHRYRP